MFLQILFVFNNFLHIFPNSYTCIPPNISPEDVIAGTGSIETGTVAGGLTNEITLNYADIETEYFYRAAQRVPIASRCVDFALRKNLACRPGFSDRLIRKLFNIKVKTLKCLHCFFL